MNPTISVIVPVYKAEAYLHRCLDSILAQTLTDFELLLIDDGCPDRSGEICDEYAQKDSRVRVFHKNNGGASAARRDGVEMSRGKWITFVDSDDTIPQTGLATLLGCVSNEVDIVMGAWARYNRGSIRLIPLGIRGKMDGDTYIKALLSGIVYTGPVGKIFRRSLFAEDVFDIPSTVTNNEDLIMNLRIASNTRAILAIPSKIVYHYHYTPNSASAQPIEIQKWDQTFTILIQSVNERYRKYVYSYIAHILYKIRKTANISQSSYFHIIETSSLTFAGKVYKNIIFKESLFNRSVVLYMYIHIISCKLVNTLLSYLNYR